MKNIFIIKIDSKYLNKIIKYHININKIIKKDNYYLLSLEEKEYEKIKKYQDIYNFKIIDYDGFIKYKNILKKNSLFLITFLVSFLFLIFLSNIVFSISIKTNNQSIKELITNELTKNNLKIYGFIKNYKEKEKIKENILLNNKDKLEWLEITRVGSKYIVEVEERIINKENIDTTPKDIVALKNAIILKIDAKTGSIVKKLNDYVKKGEVIVTGKITHKDEIVDLVSADAIIYGETWYNVHVSYPITYYEKTYTGNKKNRFKFTFLNHEIKFFNNGFQEEEIKETKIFSHKFLPIKLTFDKVLEVKIIDDVYTEEEAILKAVSLARLNILKKLPKDSKILSEKKLKIIINNSTIDIDVFFKVYENITDTKKIELDIKEGE